MANNRMWLRCKGCGKKFFLGKRFGDGYYIAQYESYKGVPLMDRLNQFYDEHEWCGNEGLDCFELVYEDPPAPLTNADRIRAMTDEELAELMEDKGDCPPIECPHDGEGAKVTRLDCKACWLDWLKQEAKE